MGSSMGLRVVRVIKDRVCDSDTAGVLIPPYVYFGGP